MRIGLRSAAGVGAVLALASSLLTPAALAQPRTAPAKPVPAKSAPEASVLVPLPTPAPIDLPTPSHAALLERLASIHVTVDESQDTVQALTRLAAEGGAKLSNCAPFSCSLRVPVGKLEELLQRIARLGRADRPEIQINDLGEQWLEQRSSLDALAQNEAVLHSIASKEGDATQRIDLLQRLDSVRMHMASTRQQLMSLEDRGRNATVQITIDHPLRPPDESIEFHLPIRWLSQIGPDHLINPPHQWLRSTMIADMHFALAIGRTADGAHFAGTRTLGEVGFAMRMGDSGKKTPLGYALGVDLGLGAAGGPGFVYELRWMFGPGLTFGNRSRISLIGGIGSSGITGGPMPSAGELPVELNVATDLGRRLRVIAFSRIAWIFGREARQDGSRTLSFTDEWVNGGWLALGERNTRHSTDGFGLGFQVHETMGSRIYTGMISYRGTIREAPDEY